MEQTRRRRTARRRPHPVFGRRAAQRGGIAPFMVLALTGALMAAAYTVDVTRMASDASQLKRATDAAALAVAREYVRLGDDFAEVRDTLAEDYVRANLGMDAHLKETLDTVTVTEGRNGDGNLTFRIEAGFVSPPTLGGSEARPVTVHSTAELRVAFTEVALALPNTLSEDGANLSALRRIGKEFAENLIGDSDNTWLALVPYSQAVNVYDAGHPGRITDWAISSALRPVELTSLFRLGYKGLHDARIPDRKARLLCMYRGLNRGENYFWDEAPSGRFHIYYRHDLPENGSPGAAAISWVGPNPDFGQANGVEDTRWMVADKGCPSAALLPLTNDLDEIGGRLDQMSTRFNVNYAIAMGWAAMALAPSFRDSGGWGLDGDLPQDFDDGSGERLKVVILLANSTDQRWFDTDSYNAYVGQKIDGDSDLGGGESSVVTQRFANLCSSFRARRLKFYLIVTGNDEAADENGQITSASDFRRIAGAGLQVCAEKESDLTYLSGADFVASESAIKARLETIVRELRQAGGFIRLIE
jgi:hypothetical protein